VPSSGAPAANPTSFQKILEKMRMLLLRSSIQVENQTMLNSMLENVCKRRWPPGGAVPSSGAPAANPTSSQKILEKMRMP
jgi:hypothetical protein